MYDVWGELCVVGFEEVFEKIMTIFTYTPS